MIPAAAATVGVVALRGALDLSVLLAVMVMVARWTAVGLLLGLKKHGAPGFLQFAAFSLSVCGGLQVMVGWRLCLDAPGVVVTAGCLVIVRCQRGGRG